MKEDRETYFAMRTRQGREVDAISPLCQAGVDRDAAAFAALMAHLRDTDLERTVVMVQVENENGPAGRLPGLRPSGRGGLSAGDAPRKWRI